MQKCVLFVKRALTSEDRHISVSETEIQCSDINLSNELKYGVHKRIFGLDFAERSFFDSKSPSEFAKVFCQLSVKFLYVSLD